MEKDLLTRQQDAETKFNKLTQERQQKQTELTDIDAELNRLQGEYRLIEELKKTSAAPTDAPAEVKK